MASTTVFFTIICIVLIGVLFFILSTKAAVRNANLLATPMIPVENAIRSFVGSSIIHASAEAVFEELLRVNDYSKWSSFMAYNWKDLDADGVPLVGSDGTCVIFVEGFTSRNLPVKLTLLDKETKTIAVRTTAYPSWLLRSEIVQEVLPIQGKSNVCEYRTWHTIEGLGAYFLLLLAGEELAEAHQNSADNLKTFIENR